MTMPYEEHAREVSSARSVASWVAFVRRQFARHRVLRFLVVGAINTLVAYLLFLAALVVLPTFPALCVATILGVLFNFMSTGTYVFGSRDPRRIWRFYGVYVVTFIYNAVGLALLARIGIGPRIGAILLLPGGVTMSYLLNRRFVFNAPPPTSDPIDRAQTRA